MKNKLNIRIPRPKISLYTNFHYFLTIAKKAIGILKTVFKGGKRVWTLFIGVKSIFTFNSYTKLQTVTFVLNVKK